MCVCTCVRAHTHTGRCRIPSLPSSQLSYFPVCQKTWLCQFSKFALSCSLQGSSITSRGEWGTSWEGVPAWPFATRSLFHGRGIPALSSHRSWAVYLSCQERSEMTSPARSISHGRHSSASGGSNMSNPHGAHAAACPWAAATEPQAGTVASAVAATTGVRRAREVKFLSPHPLPGQHSPPTPPFASAVGTEKELTVSAARVRSPSILLVSYCVQLLCQNPFPPGP